MRLIHGVPPISCSGEEIVLSRLQKPGQIQILQLASIFGAFDVVRRTIYNQPTFVSEVVGLAGLEKCCV